MSSATYTLPFSTTTTVAASSSIQPSSTTIASTSVPVETLISVLQRLEAKLDVFDPRPSASRPPPDPDPPYGLSWEWSSPSWTPASLATHSMEVSVPPWTSSTLPASSWPQAESFRQGFHEPISGMGLHTSGPPPHNSWDPPRSRIGLHTSSPPPHNSWEPPRSRAGDYIGHRSSWEQSASQGPSSSYEFDPILGRPLTSWDLPRPRIAPESCSNHSDWDYWVPPTYSESYGGGGGYSKYSNNYNDYYNNEPQAWPCNHESSYSHYGGGYSGGGYANEHSPYVPPPLPPQDNYYVPAPRPIPLSHPQPQHPWGSPGSLTISNAPQFTIAAERETAAEGEREGGVTEMADEEGGLSRAENKDEALFAAARNGESETVNSLIAAGVDVISIDAEGLPKRNAKGDPGWEYLEERVTVREYKVLDEESKAVKIAWERPLTEVHANIICSRGGHVLNIGVDMGLENSSIQQYSLISYSCIGAHPEEYVCMLPTGEGGKENGFDPFKLILGRLFPNVARGGIALKFYSLAEVYKDLLYLHLEDKVILKGGGVDTLIN